MIAAVCYSIWAHASRAADEVSAANASRVFGVHGRGCSEASMSTTYANIASRASRSANYDSASEASEYELALGASDPRSKR